MRLLTSLTGVIKLQAKREDTLLHRMARPDITLQTVQSLNKVITKQKKPQKINAKWQKAVPADIHTLQKTAKPGILPQTVLQLKKSITNDEKANTRQLMHKKKHLAMQEMLLSSRKLLTAGQEKPLML